VDNASLLVTRLKEWAKTHKVPITQELAQIERKLAKFASKTSTRSKNDERQKSSKKPDKPKKVANNARVTSSSEKINFNVKKIVLPVKGACHFCKAKSASQFVYTLTNSQKVIVCGNCVGKQRKRNKKKAKVKPKDRYVDAMERLVPGSYGSGRKSR